MTRIFITASLLVACAAVRSRIEHVVSDAAQLHAAQKLREEASAPIKTKEVEVLFNTGPKGFVLVEDNFVGCVNERSQADGHVLPGDKLVKVNGRPISPEDPLAELSNPSVSVTFARDEPAPQECDAFFKTFEKKPMGIGLAEGMLVETVGAASAASHADRGGPAVQPGDQLIMVNGQCVVADDYDKVVGFLQGDTTMPMTLKFRRPFPFSFEVKLQPEDVRLLLGHDMVVDKVSHSAELLMIQPGDLLISVNGQCKFPEDYDAVYDAHKKELRGSSKIKVAFARYRESGYEKRVQANDFEPQAGAETDWEQNDREQFGEDIRLEPIPGRRTGPSSRVGS